MRREACLSVALLAVFTLAACGGGGGGSTPHAAQSSSVSGTIYGVDSNTINLNGGTGCGYVNVTYTGATQISYNGYSLAPGVYAAVTGTGSCTTSFAASQIRLGAAPSFSSGAPAGPHVPTADYVGYGGSQSISPAVAATVLNWAELTPGVANGFSAAGIKTLAYINPFFQATTDPLYSSDESTFAHDCNGDRITTMANATVLLYLMNPSSPDLLNLLNTWAAQQEASGHIDAFFFDDVDTLYGVSPLPCNATQSSWDAANASFISGTNYPVVFNGYAEDSDSATLINGANVTGGMVEYCYTGTAPLYTTGSQWVLHENLQLAAGAAGKLFFCYNNTTTDGSSSTALREYVYASFLLTYNPASSILWEYFSTPSNVHVFPETGLVPSSPLVATPANISGIEYANVYIREYAACSLAGKSVGPCAAVVNADPNNSYALPPLSGTYGHTMTLSGYGTLDGGTVGTAGPPPPTTVPPQTGLVLLP